jgi:hypothetical protein
MIRKLLQLQRWPLKRVVLVADRGLLSLNNLQEIDKLQATLDAEGAGVQVQYVLAVPAARYGEFGPALQELDAKHEVGGAAWVEETVWQREDREQKLGVVVAHDPEAAARRTALRRKQIQELITLGEQWGGCCRTVAPRPSVYHAVKEARLAHLIKVDLKSDLFSFSID